MLTLSTALVRVGTQALDTRAGRCLAQKIGRDIQHDLDELFEGLGFHIQARDIRCVDIIAIGRFIESHVNGKVHDLQT